MFAVWAPSRRPTTSVTVAKICRGSLAPATRVATRRSAACSSRSNCTAEEPADASIHCHHPRTAGGLSHIDSPGSVLARRDLVDRALRERHDVQVAVRARLDIRAHPEVAAEQEALALGDLPLVDVVRDAVLKSRVVGVHRAAVAAELDPEQVTALEEVAGAGHEQVA